jgi:isoleucyl-tRNA synthetase
VISTDFKSILQIKENVFKALEIARMEKKIGKSLEAKVLIVIQNKLMFDVLAKYKNELTTICIVSQVQILDKQIAIKDFLSSLSNEICDVYVFNADGTKCPRCWKHATDIGKNSKHSTICLPCAEAVEEK